MASLVSIFGGPWSPPPQPVVLPPETQLYQAILDAGLTPPDDIYLDGVLRRFRSGTKGSSGHGDKSGWYVAFSDQIPAGRFGDWRSGIEQSWRADTGRKLSAIDELHFSRRMAEARAKRDEEIAKSREVAADTVEAIWSSCIAASADHPYLARKGVGAHGARVTGDGRLVVPLYDSDGCLSSLQYIDQTGGKLYHPGGKTGACFWWVGDTHSADMIYIAEGYATASTIHEVTGKPCIVAYSASNLVPVTGIMREHYKTVKLVIVADNDASGVGRKYADQASAKYGAHVIMPPILGDANDYKQAGHDLALLLEPPTETQWLIPADDLAGQPAPIAWLVKHWLQEKALCMIHGPSGGGKTFVILDWCLRMASGLTDAWGHKVKPATVVYLAGEGHHGLRGRIAAWKQYYAPGRKLRMYLSASGCDLNKPEGLLKAIEAIRALPEAPGLIVVDTLHRFLNGNENDAADARTMLDACATLMDEFSSSVCLIHHTGVSEEAQHRARGSSAWRGALDIEISVVPGDEHKPIELVQRKSKDAELAASIFVKLQKVEISGWLDEDGEPVTSAILESVAPPVKPEKSTTLGEYKKMIGDAWWNAGAAMRGAQPYISRDALKELLRDRGLSEQSVKNYCNPGANGKPIYTLIHAEVIAEHEQGWIVTDLALANAMAVRKGG